MKKLQYNRILNALKFSMNRMSIFFQSPLKVFVLLAAVFGLVFIVLMPPFTGSDEEAHFVRAYGLSEGDILLVNTTQVEVPTTYRQTIGCFQYKTPQPGETYTYIYGQYGIDKKIAFDCAFNLPLDRNNTEPVITTASFYSPTTYLPQVLAIHIGKLFNLPIIVIAYLTRLAVLIAYIFMVAVAIRLLPVRKWALAGIALLPHSIIHVTNPGGDYMLLGLTALLVAIVVRSFYLTKEQLDSENRKLLLSLAIISSLIMLPKGMFPGICLMPVLLFYGGLKYKLYRKIGVVSFALLVGAIWQKIGAPAILGQSSEASSNSVTGLPAEFIRTMYYRWTDADFLQVGDPVGVFQRLGIHAGTPSLIITVISILFAIYVFVGYPEKLKIKVSKTTLSLLTIVGVICAVGIVGGSFAALYLASSGLQDGTGVIRGVQARYFYPAFFVLVALPFVRYFHTTKSIYSKVVVAGTIMVLSSYVVTLLFQFRWGIF